MLYGHYFRLISLGSKVKRRDQEATVRRGILKQGSETRKAWYHEGWTTYRLLLVVSSEDGCYIALIEGIRILVKYDILVK